MYLIHSFLLELITQPFGDDGRLEDEQREFILIIIKLVIESRYFQISKISLDKNRSRLDHFSILLRLGNVNIQVITIKLRFISFILFVPLDWLYTRGHRQ